MHVRNTVKLCMFIKHYTFICCYVYYNWQCEVRLWSKFETFRTVSKHRNLKYCCWLVTENYVKRAYIIAFDPQNECIHTQPNGFDIVGHLKLSVSFRKPFYP